MARLAARSITSTTASGGSPASVEPAARVELFAELADHFKSLVAFPPEFEKLKARFPAASRPRT